MNTHTGTLPCIGHADLYDIALFDDADSAQRQQAVHRAAALCRSCPAQCDQKVTANTGPRELVLLEPGWMPPEVEGKADPAPPNPARPRKHEDVKVGEEYVKPDQRVAHWAVTASKRAEIGHSLADLAAYLCVDEDTATRLIALADRLRAGMRAA